MVAQLRIEGREQVVVVLSNPGRANSVTPDLMMSLAQIFRDIDRDSSVMSVVITGDGDFFCAGADLEDMRSAYDENGVEAATDYMVNVWMPSVQRAALAINACSKVTVAAVNGPASGGGLDVALLCDYVIAVPTAKLAESYVNLGLLPVAGGIDLASRRMPIGAARRFLLSGVARKASDMHALGLIDELAERERLMARARDVAAEMSAAPEVTQRAYRSSFSDPTGAYERQLAHALHSNSLLLRDPAVQQRVIAVMERSRPSVAESSEHRGTR